MSELKAFDVGLGQYTEDGSPCVVAFDADKNPRLLNEKVYLKSEADKVIAELEENHKKEVGQLLRRKRNMSLIMQPMSLMGRSEKFATRSTSGAWRWRSGVIINGRFTKETRITGN